MAPKRRTGKKLLKSLRPIVLVLALALVAVLAYIVYEITRPPRRAYLVTPQSFSQISGPILRVTDETWRNRDGTTARGWLLRGSEKAPAVVFLHRYGGDRSWLFNLGVKLNEATNFTILWPDLRGHGLDPPVNSSTFGVNEGNDVLASVDFLRTLKTSSGGSLIGDHIGLYGVELGAYAALYAALHDPSIRALALDSVPLNADDLLRTALKEDVGVNNPLSLYLTRMALRVYFLGKFENRSACEMASSLRSQRVLLLSGEDAGPLRNSTVALQNCFRNRANLEVNTDLPLTGFKLPSATGVEGEGYDRRVIDFLDKSLR
jgi:pimeloyl-ACP methyl ester carboxylesterase